MTTTDFSKITTLAQLRKARKEISDERSDFDRALTGRLHSLQSAFSLRTYLLPIIRMLRKTLSGTPFAKP